MSIRQVDYPNSPSTSLMTEDGTAEPYSLIDKHSVFDGTFTSNRDLRIEGQVKGTIQCKGTLFVAQGANVSARVEAEHIAVAGDLDGDIACRGRLQLLPSGRVRGKVNTGSLVVNEGAFYEGQLEMAARPEPVAPRPIQPVTSAPVSSNIQTSPLVEPISAEVKPNAEPASSTFIRRLGGAETAWDSRDSADESTPEPAGDDS